MYAFVLLFLVPVLIGALGFIFYREKMKVRTALNRGFTREVQDLVYYSQPSQKGLLPSKEVSPPADGYPLSVYKHQFKRGDVVVVTGSTGYYLVQAVDLDDNYAWCVPLDSRTLLAKSLPRKCELDKIVLAANGLKAVWSTN